ncbi:hypothetical protein EDD21DRAFT_411665 [Dissophora ornata]|nr:hypothetical protein EDD21DRAFT_411665 [Dissophora ornata]
MIGLCEGVFKPRRVKEEGKRVFKFHCLQLECESTFAASSSSTSLTYYIKSKHRDLYKEPSKWKQVDMLSSSSLTQTALDMSSVPAAKRNKIYMVTLEWIIGDVFLFSTLDSELFQTMVQSYISSVKAPYGATVRAL